MQELSIRLSEKEEELEGIKRLLIEKMRELESSFIEISQDMIESD